MIAAGTPWQYLAMTTTRAPDDFRQFGERKKKLKFVFRSNTLGHGMLINAKHVVGAPCTEGIR